MTIIIISLAFAIHSHSHTIAIIASTPLCIVVHARPHRGTSAEVEFLTEAKPTVDASPHARCSGLTASDGQEHGRLGVGMDRADQIGLTAHGHGPWRTNMPPRTAINFIHAMQIRHGPEFYGSGSDMQILQTWPWPTGAAEPGVCHNAEVCHVVQACKLHLDIAGLVLARTRPAASIPPPYHPPPWNHQSTTGSTMAAPRSTTILTQIISP